VKRRLKRLAGRRWTKEGAVVIQVSEERSQARNREIARERLAELIRRATVAPKKRRPTKPTKGSVERRIKAKKVRGEVKGLRGKVEEIANGRAASRSAEEVGPGLRRALAGSHVVFFREDAEAVTVVRVLHQRMDVGRA
jgi:plasmid stabilization system protein ParE